MKSTSNRLRWFLLIPKGISQRSTKFHAGFEPPKAAREITMRFYKELYISPPLAKKRRKIMWKLRTGRPQPLIYVIALAKNSDLLEIYHSGILKQKYYKKKENAPYIVGIALGYGGAVALATDMLMEVSCATGAYDVKAYFKSRSKGSL